MLGFLRARVFEDPQLGRFKRVRTMWLQETQPIGLGVTMEGGKERPLPEVVEAARRLLNEPKAAVRIAKAKVHNDARALEFMQGNGELICDGFTVYQSGRFAVEFSLSAWPDAMISVLFNDDAPCDVLLND